MPLAFKVGVFVSLISTAGAVVLGIAAVTLTRQRIDNQYASEAAALKKIISAEVTRHPTDYELANELLAVIVQTHPSLLRIRLFRGARFDLPLVWASSYHTDLALDAGRDMAQPAGRVQNEAELDGQAVFLDLEPVEYPNGVTSIAFYFEAGPRRSAIAATARQVLIDSAFVIGLELLALTLAMYWLVLRRVKRLGRAAAAVAAGDLSVTLPEGGGRPAGDELTESAREFDHMVRAVEARTLQQATVVELGRRALARSDLHGLFADAVELTAQALAADGVELLELTEPDTLTLRASSGFDGASPGAVTVPIGRRPHAWRALIANGSIIEADPAEETHLAFSQFREDRGVLASASVMIPTGEGPFGVLTVASQRIRTFTGDDIAFMEAITNVLSETIEREAALSRERASEERYRMVVENATELIALVKMGGEIIYASPSFGTMLGREPRELVGTNIGGILSPVYNAKVIAARDALEAGKPVPVRGIETRTSGGAAIHLEGTVAPIRGAGGEIRYALAIFHDVTERLEAQEERRRFLARLMAAQEEERLRIAADLHDDPIQTMTAAALRIESVRKFTKDPDQLASLDKLEDTISRAINRLRRLMFELRPPALDREGLAAALRDSVGNAAMERGFTFGFESRLVSEPDSVARTIAYRVAKEALVNITKHAEATHVELTVDPLEGGVRIRIKDDGVGFDARSAQRASDHIGLSTMRERTVLAGGWCHIESLPGTGTTVEFFVPPQTGAHGHT